VGQIIDYVDQVDWKGCTKVAEHVPYLKVPRKQGENVRRSLIELKLLATDLRIISEEEHLLIPLLRQPINEESEALRRQSNTIEFGTGEFQEEAKPVTMLDLLEDRVPPHVLAGMPKSLDIIGHVAVVETTAELQPYKALIGEAVLAANKTVRTVLAKTGPIGTQYRLRQFEILAGEDRTETLYIEHGCRYLLDLRKVYFSPRLSYEHDRVSRLVNEGEKVVDMFAGVGPFSILIAKRRSLIQVYAIDLNPEAVKYLEENVRLNRLRGKVTALLGDCRSVICQRLRSVADRVIMNFPSHSFDYVDSACYALKPTGGVIHLYTFSDEQSPFENLKCRLEESVSSAGRSVKEISCMRTVKAVAPYRLQVVADAVIA